MADRYKDDFFEKKENLTDYNNGYLQGQLNVLADIIGVGHIVKMYKSNK